jgi:hypothetical protein
VLQVYDLLKGTPYGERHRHRYILDQIVRNSIYFIGLYLITIPLAPNTQAFSTSEYDGALRHDAGLPDVVPMTRLQVAMSREIGGWPLYTIVIGLGQVYTDLFLVVSIANANDVDAKCHEFPDHFVDRSKLAR